MAAVVKGAVEDGDHASNSKVVREALRGWKMKQVMQSQELTSLRADINEGLGDLAEGRVKDFASRHIVERGRKLSADRSA